MLTDQTGRDVDIIYGSMEEQLVHKKQVSMVTPRKQPTILNMQILKMPIHCKKKPINHF